MLEPTKWLTFLLASFSLCVSLQGRGPYLMAQGGTQPLVVTPGRLYQCQASPAWWVVLCGCYTSGGHTGGLSFNTNDRLYVTNVAHYICLNLIEVNTA